MKIHKRNISKPVLFLTASLMACQPVSALAVTFSDLDNVPWPGAETPIQKAADLGLMVGETQDGKTVFRPKDNVSLCEMAQLAYKLTVNTGKFTPDSSVTEKWTSTLQTYNIPDWAYPAMAYCLEKNIIAVADLSGFMQDNSPAPASREKAVEILGRALVAAVPSFSASGSTSFGDNDAIAESARPYAALLAQEKIVNGDSEGNFNPKRVLNRTETAVLVSNLHTLLSNAAAAPASSTLEGVISGLTNFYVNFKDSNSYYYFAENPEIKLNGKTVEMPELTALLVDGPEMNATLTLNGSGRITAISVKAETPDELTGIITEFSSSSITIGSKTYSIKDSEGLRITLDNTIRKFNYLMDTYKDGVTLSATVTLNTDNRVSKIDAKTISSNAKKGKITHLSKDEIELDNEKSKTFDIKDTDTLAVVIDGSNKVFDDLMDLYKEDETISATLTVDSSNHVTKIVAVSAKKSSSNKGVISSLSKSKLKLKGNDEEFTIKAATSIDIDIEDGTKESKIKSWEDLETAVKEKKELTVTVTMNNGSVSKITGEVTAVKGTLSGYSQKDIDIVSSEENRYTYVFADKVIVENSEINANNLDALLTWMDEYFKKGDNIKATLTLRDGCVTRIDN